MDEQHPYVEAAHRPLGYRPLRRHALRVMHGDMQYGYAVCVTRGARATKVVLMQYGDVASRAQSRTS